MIRKIALLFVLALTVSACEQQQDEDGNWLNVFGDFCIHAGHVNAIRDHTHVSGGQTEEKLFNVFNVPIPEGPHDSLTAYTKFDNGYVSIVIIDQHACIVWTRRILRADFYRRIAQD